MNDFKEVIAEAKEKTFEKFIELIIEDLQLENWNGKFSKCPFHSEDSASFSPNYKNHTWHCFGCGKTYSYIDHMISHYGLKSHEAVKKILAEAEVDYIPNKKKEDVSNKKYIYPKLVDKERYQVEKYMLENRCISKSTLDFFGVTGDSYGNIIFNFYDENDILTFYKARISKDVTDKKEKKILGIKPSADPKKPEILGAGDKPILFGMNMCAPIGTLYITEGECFPPFAEILTENGWVKFEDYNGKSKVMSVDNNMNGHLVYPNRIIKKEFKGNLLKFQNRNYYSMTTPKHNLVYLLNGEVIKREAENMPSNLLNAKIPMAISHNGEGVGFSLAQLALLIAVSADGTLDSRKNGNKYVRISFKKNRKIERFENILKNNNIEYIKTIQDARKEVTFFGFTAPSWLTSKIFDHSMLLKMTQEQKNFFISEILYWDGNSVPNRNQIEYSSKEYSNALFIQTLSHLCGYNSSIIKRKNDLGNWYKVSILFGKNSVSWQSNSMRKEYVPHEGMVYCVSVDTGMILVRQGEKISVSGNCDALSMHEAGVSNVVSIPFGANTHTWIEYNYQWLSNFEKIVFIFDNDEAGLKARREAIVRLGNHRCRFVDIPKEYSISDDSKVHLKDANDVLVKLGKDKLFEFVQVEKELPLEGIINLEDAEDFNPESWEGIKTGIADLDKNILYKIFLGTVVTFTGTPGSGKSTVINQIFVSQAIEQGYGVTIFSGELTPSILRGWIEINMAGREHTTLKQDKENGNFIRVISKENKEKIKNWYRNKIHVLKDDDNNIDTVLSRAEQTVRVNGDKIIILDNMATLSIGDNDSNTYSKQTEMMNKLKAFAGKFNVLVVLVIHPRKPQNGGSAEGAGGYEMGGSSALYNLCHYNFSIRRISDKEKEGIKNKRDGSWKVKPNLYDSELRCHKNRLMGTIGSVMLYFDYSYRFYKYPKELWYRFGWDKDNPNPIPNHDPNSHETPFDNDDE